MTNHNGSGDAPGQANHKYNKLIDEYKSKLNQYAKKKIPLEELKNAETKLCDYYVDNSSALRFYEKIFKEKLIWPEDIIKKSKEFPLIKPLDIEKIKKRVEERKNKTPKKFVLTGCSGSGKSSLIHGLEIEKEYVINETAEKCIRYGQAMGNPEPWNDKYFQKQIFELHLRQEELLKDKRVFMDRSIIDVYVYTTFFKHYSKIPQLEKLIEQEKENKRYDKIFYINQLKSFKKEGYRRENDGNESRIIGEKILKTYQELGYEIVFVPDTTLKERIDFILANSK
jgi:predicted ATPase